MTELTVSQLVQQNKEHYNRADTTYRKGKYTQALTSKSKLSTGPLQGLTNAIGGTIGTIAGPVGWLGENLASPLTGLEKIAGYGKELAKSPFKLGKEATETLYSAKALKDIQGSEERARQIADKATSQAIQEFRAGKIDKNTLAKRLKAFQTGTDVISEATEGVKGWQEMAATGLDVASLLPVGAAVSSSVKGITAAGKAAKATGLFKVAAKTGPSSALMEKLALKTPGAAKVLRGTGSALTAVGRTGAGKIAGAVETGFIKTGASTEIGHQLGKLTGSETGKANKAELIKEGKLRTAVDIATSLQAAIPFVSSTASKLNETKNILAQGLVKQETLRKIDNYFKGVPEFTNPIPLQGSKQTTNLRELVANEYIRFCTETLQKDLNHIVPADWDRFTRQMVKDGKWKEGDALQNITHVKSSAVLGPEAEWMREKPTLVEGKTGKEVKEIVAPREATEMEESIQRVVDSGKRKYEVITKTPKDVAEKGRMFKVGAAYDVLQGLPKVELTKVQQKVVNELEEFRKTKTGKYFMTKVENGSLMRDIEGLSESKLDAVTGGKGKKLMAKLNQVLDRVESKYTPVGNVKNLRQKYVEMALLESRMPASKAKQVMQALSDANYEALKMNDIVSMKAKLATLSPKFNQLDRAYMSARFGLRPFFWLMQTTESTVYGGIAKGDLKHQVAKDVSAKILATPEYGKGAKNVTSDMKISGTSEVLEKTTATSEKIKRAKAQALHFTDTYAEALMNTPYGKKFKSVDDIPAFKEYVKGLKESKEPVNYIHNFIKENMPNGKTMAEQGMVDDASVASKYAIRKAANTAAKRGEPMYLYNTSRSPFERGLHQIMFPASYTKKIVTEGSKWLTKGTGGRVLITDQGLKQYGELRNKIEDKAVTTPQLRPVIALMNVFDPLSTDFPLSVGGATPFYRTIEKMATNPGKYNIDTAKGANEVLKQLAPALKEYERYIGFGYNVAGKEEPKYAQSFYPKYLEANREAAKGKIFNQE